MKARKPEGVDPLVWEHLPHGARLALMSHYARTPERREQLRRAAMQHTAQQLDRMNRELERHLNKQQKRGPEHE